MDYHTINSLNSFLGGTREFRKRTVVNIYESSFAVIEVGLIKLNTQYKQSGRHFISQCLFSKGK